MIFRLINKILFDLDPHHRRVPTDSDPILKATSSPCRFPTSFPSKRPMALPRTDRPNTAAVAQHTATLTTATR